MNLSLHNKQKIAPVKLGRLIHMADYFLYASKYLIDKTVIAMNSDIGNPNNLNCTRKCLT